MQPLNRAPLLTSAKHWRLGREQIFGDLAPADATVDLNEVSASLYLGTQRAAAFQLAVDLTVETLDFYEGSLPCQRL